MSVIADGAAAALLAFCYDLARAKLTRASEPKGASEGGMRRRVGPGGERDGTASEPGDPGAAGRRAGRAGRLATLAVTAGAVIACLPLVPLPLPAAATLPLPAGWSAVFAALRLPSGARVLVVPVPTATLTDALRWQADTGEPVSLIGGYFTGPATTGQAYVDGNGPAATTKYLDGLWAGPAIAAPAPSQAKADLNAWRPAAVVAVTSPSSPLGRYLERFLGAPRVQSGSVLGWRL
jgi:hypothetical protein